MVRQLLKRAMWNRAYRNKARWDLGGPDPFLVRVLDERGIIGPGHAIDLGCGTGDNAIELARRGFTTVGIDWAERAITQARRKAERAGVNVDFRVGDITAPHGIDGLFDLLVVRLVFLPLTKRARHVFASTMSRLARPGGKAVLLEPVLVEAPSFPSREWLAAKLNALVLSPGEIEGYLKGAFSVEVAERRPSRTQRKRWQLGPGRVEDYMAFWLTRRG